jgi:hypothetical protein
MVGPEDRGVVAGSGLVQRLYERVDPGRHHEQVARGLAALCVSICVLSSLRCQDRAAGPGCDPVPLRRARVRLLDDHKIAFGATKLATREIGDEVHMGHAGRS